MPLVKKRIPVIPAQSPSFPAACLRFPLVEREPKRQRGTVPPAGLLVAMGTLASTMALGNG